ncbi:MAG: efflux RND transporter periplasmic adaptor subunit, partial [Vicinamibacterales bacterium]|nr:efflux RND transporter periplasmic adaptor subunit [Vicinamibacterales bacterium]
IRSLCLLAALSPSLLAGCTGRGADPAAAEVGTPPVVHVAPVTEAAVNRTLRVTGTLVADEEAEVAAETAGRVVSTPVERGTRVGAGTVLVELVATEAGAQATEAEANVAQLEARLAMTHGMPFVVDDVPEVRSARASRDLAEADFARIRNLLEQRVVSQAEFDLRRTQADAARHQAATVTNAAQQTFRQLEAARARAVLARKALADTAVRAPFAGLVVERKVSIGDFVTRGTKVATVVRITPLRVELSIPEHAVGSIGAGQLVRLLVDAYPGRVFDAHVRYVAPALRADQRALVAEAVTANADAVLKPGMFVTAEVELPATTPSLMVPSAAVQSSGGFSQVFVVRGDRVRQRMITPGAVVGDRTEVINGVAAGESVAIGALAGLTDGLRVSVAGAAPRPPSQ